MAVGDETENIELTTSWQLLAAGPLLIQLKVGPKAELRIDASLPGAGDDSELLTRKDGDAFRTYNGTKNVYGRKTAGTPEAVILAYGE